MKRDTRRDPKKQEGKRRLRGVIEVRVSAEIRRGAERLAADNANGTLEEVLSGLVEDMTEAWERPGSWEAAALCGWMSSHPWPRRERPVLDDEDDLEAPRRSSSYGAAKEGGSQ